MGQKAFALLLKSVIQGMHFLLLQLIVVVAFVIVIVAVAVAAFHSQ